MNKKMLLNEDGYTIVEILISLVLLSILILFTTNVFTLVSSRELRDNKFAAIEIAKKQMHITISSKKYEDSVKEIVKNYILKQKFDKHDDLVYLTISIYKKNSDRLIYELHAIQPFEKDKK